jgi:hypothetical protein
MVASGAILAAAALRQAAQQADRIGVAWIAKDVLGPSLLDEAAGIEHAHPLAHLGDDRQVVADEEDRGREFATQLDDQVEDLGLHGGVESGRGFVEHEERRLAGQRHGDRHALLHAARKLVRIALHHAGRIADPHPRQHVCGAPRSLVADDARQLVDLFDLAPDAQRRIERLGGILIDHRQGLAPHLPQPVAVERQQVSAVYEDAPAADRAVAWQIAQHREGDRRLAAAGFPDQPIRLAAADLEVDVV